MLVLVQAGLQPGDTPGGGPDPCVEKIKSLAVVASGCDGVSSFVAGPSPPPPPGGPSLFTFEATVPLGATAAVRPCANPLRPPPRARLWKSLPERSIHGGMKPVLASTSNV